MVEPAATYRWQLDARGGFAAAAAAVGDLARLGVSHLYLSPIAEAVPGSAHGYDVTDPTRVRRELGGEPGFRDLVDTCRRHGVGVVVDVVPNHLAAHRTNPFWWDVLRLGRRSRWAPLFDIDWNPPKTALRETVLMPVLGDHYGRVLERGEIRLERGDGPGRVLVIRYHDHELPVSPAATGGLLGLAARATGDDVLGVAARLLARAETDKDPPAGLAERDADIGVAEHAALARLQDPACSDALDRELRGVAADAERLDDLLESQHHRLARWQVGASELVYRRFFDVDSLVATRTEVPGAFEVLLGLPVRLAREGLVDGLRIDHVDGLREPARTLERLHDELPEGTWVVVEKILHRDEELPTGWPVAGTTGYEVADLLGGWLTDPAGADAQVRTWRDATDDERPFEQVRVAARREVLATSLVADVERLTGVLVRVCEGRRRHRDHARQSLREAMVETAVHLPAYRTYLSVDAASSRLVASPVDEAMVAAAADAAGEARPDLDPELLGLLRDILSGRFAGEAEAEFVLRFQQLTGPVAAKGEEDSAFYRYLPLPHRCEVGADPSRPVVTADEWHEAAARTASEHPATMTTLTTHDTKRSADVRARLATLSTVPQRAAAGFHQWVGALGASKLSAADEWLIFHTLVGAWPITVERASAAIEKSMREAGVATSWIDPDTQYETAAREVVQRSMSDPVVTQHVEGLVSEIADAGWAAALAQLLVQLLAPGVPDLYQGSECWDLSLVDPDNRRGLDAGQRTAVLDAAADLTVAEAWADPVLRGGGVVRATLVRTTLAARVQFGPLGAYRPLLPRGPDAGRALAFERGDGRGVVVVAARPGPKARIAADVHVALPEGRWVDLLDGTAVEGDVSLAGRALPLALLAATR